MTKMLLTLAGILVANLFAATSQCHAGNVVVNLSADGLLSIQGDAESNSPSIRIAEDLTIAASHGTTINGETGPVSFDPLDVKQITVNMGKGGGRPRVFFEETIIADLSIENISRVFLYSKFLSDSIDLIGDIRINSGRGGNVIVVDGLRQIGDLDISTGHGTDLIYFENVDSQNQFFIDGSVSINTGGDRDQVEMILGSSPWMAPPEITGDLTVELGQGHDSFRYRGSPLVVGESVYLGGGQGNDDSTGDELIIADEFLKIGFED